MKKIEIEADRVYYPMPCAIVGATVGERPNYLTVAWFSMVNPKPPCLAVAMNKAHYTNQGISENKTFSINIPSSRLVKATDYCGLVSGKRYDKASVFETFYGKLKTAPMVKECPFNAELRLISTVDLSGEDLFIGEIVAAYVDEDCLTNGMPDLKKIDPFMLRPDRRYVKLGEVIAQAWEVGKTLLQSK